MKFLFGLIFLLLIACTVSFGFLAWQGSKHAVVILEWTTASEVDTAGFNIYRREDTEDKFELVNTQIIPASADPLLGAAYSYTDTNVEPGKMYYYLLEDVGMNGQVTRNDPIEMKARADYWLNLSISMLSFGLAILLLLNRQMFIRKSDPVKA